MKRVVLPALLAALSIPCSASLLCVDTGDGNAITWNVGQPIVWSTVSYEDPPTVTCWASGHELVYVRSHFTGLRGRTFPTLDDSTQIIYSGDDANFIWDNL